MTPRALAWVSCCRAGRLMWPERSLPRGLQSPGSVTPLRCGNPRDTRPRFAALGSSQLVAGCNVPGRGFQMGSSCFNAFFASVCGFRTSLCLIPFPTYAPPLITGECHSEGKLFTAQVKKGSPDVSSGPCLCPPHRVSCGGQTEQGAAPFPPFLTPERGSRSLAVEIRGAGGSGLLPSALLSSVPQIA